MSISFKQFSTLIDAAPEQLSDLCEKLFGDEAEPEDKKDTETKVLSAKELVAKRAEERKQKAAARKQELEQKREETLLRAKERREQFGSDNKLGKLAQFKLFLLFLLSLFHIQ